MTVFVGFRVCDRLHRWNLAPDAQLAPVLEALARLGATSAWGWTEVAGLRPPLAS